MDLSNFEQDNRKSCIVESQVPALAKGEPCCLGIDEAGRGPVLGPMVYGTCYCPISKNEELKEKGFADSKTLNEEEREKLFDVIDESKEMLGWAIHILSPHDISTSMLRRSKYNLNALSHDTAIGLIQLALDKGVNLTEVYVDTVGPPEKYQEKLKGIFPNIQITVAKKADSIYPIVSAASICAKVGRDKAVKEWQFETDQKFEAYGSGYPSDPNTKKFMEASMDRVFGYPHFVRFSWSTADTILQNKAVQVEWEDEDEEDPAASGNQSVMNFFSKKDENPLQKKHSFFNDRCLKQVTGF